MKTELIGFVPRLNAALQTSNEPSALTKGLLAEIVVPEGYASPREYLVAVRFELALLLDIMIAESRTPADDDRDRLQTQTANLH